MLTSLCLSIAVAVSPLELSKAKCAAALAITLASQPGDNTPKPDGPVPDDIPAPDDKPHDKTCKCGGTGKVRSGDGLIEVPCPCDDRCKCKRRGAATAVKAGRNRQVIVVTASWCLPCRPVKEVVQKLKTAGWAVSDEETAQIRLVDPDMQPALATSLGIETIPTVLVLQDGRVESRLTGGAATALTTFAIGDLYTGKTPAATTSTVSQPQQTWTYQVPLQPQRYRRAR